MIKVDNGATATYTYDAYGRRVRSVNSGGRTRECSFDQAGNCVAEFDAYSWAWIRSDIRALGQVIATYDSDNQTYFNHNDHLGSLRAQSTVSGALKQTCTYDPFGGNFYCSGGPNTTDVFTGYEYDGETGLEHSWFRQYSGTAGRFLSPDPYAGSYDLADPQTLNRNIYVVNRAVNFVDPNGLNCQGSDTFTVYGDGSVSESGLNITSCDPVMLPFQIGIDPFGGLLTYLGGRGGMPPSSTSDQTPPKPPPSKAANNGAKPCTASKGTTSIISGNATTNAPTIPLGAAIGGAIGGPPGAFLGGIIGSFFGVGGTVSYGPSTKSWYAGGTVVFGLGLGGGTGVGVSDVMVPAGQNPNSIANGPSFSLTYQPNPFLGSTVVKSPGSGPPVVGPSGGTRIPVSGGFSYNFCLKNCGC